MNDLEIYSLVTLIIYGVPFILFVWLLIEVIRWFRRH